MALDIGTSGVKAGLYTREAKLLPETFVKHTRNLSSTPDGGFEINPLEALDQVVSAVDQLISQSEELTARVEYCGISSFWHSLMGIDRHGDPTTELYAWAETRPARQIKGLRENLNGREVHNRTGCHFHSSYWPAKLLWIKDEFPHSYGKTSTWLSFSDFLGLNLFGEDETSLSMASGTGLFDIRKLVWDKELLDFLGVSDSNLPDVSACEKTFTLNPEYSKHWPNLKQACWIPAIGDGAANNIGSACLTPRKAALMIGTSGAMRVAYEGTPPDQIPEGLWCYLVDHKRVVVGGALSDGGGLYRWLTETLDLPRNRLSIESEISKRGPAAHGLTFLPFLAGERGTGYNENAAGAILGLQTSSDQIDILQSALEAVAYRFADIYERLGSIFEIDEIIASGGALNESEVWTQIICDVLGTNLQLDSETEASLRGAALLARERAVQKSLPYELSDSSLFKANGANADAYDLGRQRHQEFYDLLIRS